MSAAVPPHTAAVSLAAPTTSAGSEAGGGNLTLPTDSNGVTVKIGASALSVTSGAQTIQVTQHATRDR